MHTAEVSKRELERAVRRWKRREQLALTDEARTAARAKVRDWQAALRQHVSSNDLKRLPYREQIGNATAQLAR